MAKSALVFSGRNGLDFIELRGGVVRIPEVSLRIREAQAILDAIDTERTDLKVDLLSMLSSDDDLFFRNIQLKSLISAIVQVGLFDRYLKTQKRPDYMVGNSNGDSAMLVCAGRMSFREMVEASQLAVSLRAAPSAIAPAAAISVAPQLSPLIPVSLVAGAMPLLSGLSLTEYNAVEAKLDGGVISYEPLKSLGGAMELRKVIAALFQDLGVERFINIGPASALRGSDYRMLGAGEIESLDSIELDPMLGWFWRNVRPQAAALSQ